MITSNPVHKKTKQQQWQLTIKNKKKNEKRETQTNPVANVKPRDQEFKCKLRQIKPPEKVFIISSSEIHLSPDSQ